MRNAMKREGAKTGENRGETKKKGSDDYFFEAIRFIFQLKASCNRRVNFIPITFEPSPGDVRSH